MAALSPLCVGRARELAVLGAGLDAAAGGRGCLFLVAGEPGIGKTRLCDELARRAEERGFSVLWGRSWEAFGAPAYWPWIQVLRTLSRQAVRLALSDDARAALRDLLPELDDAAPASSMSNVAEERFRLFDAVATLLCDASSHSPLLVILEDLHAADPSSLALLSFFARELRGAAICVVGTYRAEEARADARAAEALAPLAREGTLVLPGRLTRGEVEELMEGRSGTRPASEVTDAVLRATEGHPLFVEEVCRALQQGQERAAAAPLHLPDTVRHAIRERLSRLSAATRELLSCAAVLGREFPLDTLASLLGTDAAGARSALSEALRAAVVVSSGEGVYAFNHALVRDAVHHEIPRERRAALHARAAEALEGDAGKDHSLGEIALHLLEAAPAVGEDRALEGARRAAARALSKYAFEDAAMLLGRAIDTLESRVRDQRGLGAAFVLLGEALVREGKNGTEACLRAAEIGRRNSDPELVARAALSLGAEISPAVVNQTLVALLREALDVLPEGPGDLRARVLARLAGALQPAFDPSIPVALARESIAMARSLGDDETLRFVLLAAGSALVDYVSPAERAGIDDETLGLAHAVNDAPLAFRARLRLFFDHLELGNTLHADTNLVENERLARLLPHPRYRFYASMQRAARAVLQGRFAEALECEQAAGELVARLGESSLVAGLTLHRLGKAALRHEDDRLEELTRGVLDVLRPVQPELVSLMEAWISARSGRLGEGMAFVRALPDAASLIQFEVIGMHLIAEIRLRSGESAGSDALLASLSGKRGTFVSWGIFGLVVFAPVTWLIGCVEAARGNLEAAVHEFEDAARDAEAVGARAGLAQVLHDHAYALVVRFQKPELAAPLLDRCRVLAGELDLPRLAAKIDALANAARLRSPVLESGPASAPASEGIRSLPFSLIKDGETWTVTRGRRVFRLKDSRGLRMLAELVAAEGQELHVLSLGGGGDPGELGDAGEVIDADAARAYRTRLEALRERERDAESSGDATRASQAREEIAFLAQQLSEGFGLGGRGRRVASAAERARTNVQRRLRDAIRRIEEQDPELGRYLGWTVRTGAFCSYSPGHKS